MAAAFHPQRPAADFKPPSLMQESSSSLKNETIGQENVGPPYDEIQWREGDLCEVRYRGIWEPAKVARIRMLKKGPYPIVQIASSLDEVDGYAVRRPQLLPEDGKRKRSRRKPQNVYKPEALHPKDPNPKRQRREEKRNKDSLKKKQDGQLSKTTKKEDKSLKVKKKPGRKKKPAATAKQVESKGTAQSDKMGMETGISIKQAKIKRPGGSIKRTRCSKKEEEPWDISGDTLTLWSPGMLRQCLEYNDEMEKKRILSVFRKAQREERLTEEKIKLARCKKEAETNSKEDAKSKTLARSTLDGKKKDRKSIDVKKRNHEQHGGDR